MTPEEIRQAFAVYLDFSTIVTCAIALVTAILVVRLVMFGGIAIINIILHRVGGKAAKGGK